MKPKWLEVAEQSIGQAEVPGVGSSSWIKNLWLSLKGGWLWKQYGEDDSRLAWCGAFVAHCLKTSGVEIPKAWYRASSYLDWGVVLDTPALGCIAVVSRPGGNHVFFVAGISADRSHVVGLGGNQSDKVRYAIFDTRRVIGYRWPRDKPPGDALKAVNTALFLNDTVRME